jgi:hypothetical protein
VTEATIVGVMFAGQRAAVRELLGEERYERALARLSPRDREMVREAGMLTRVPFRVVEAFVTAGAAEQGRPIEQLQREVAAHATQRTFGGVWRILFRFTTPDALVARLIPLYHRVYDRGRLELRAFTPGERAEIVLHDFPDASDFILRGFAFGLELTLEHVGRRAVRVEWQRTPRGATYWIKWRRE